VDNAPVGNTCNGSGSCLPDPNPMSCGNYLCTQGGCNTSCADSSDCIATAWCNNSVCEPKIIQGEPCSVDESCTTSLCADGYCCNAPCLGQCEACDVVGAEGSCLPVSGTPHGARMACVALDPSDLCSQSTCNGIERTLCAGFVDVEVVCREAQCTDDGVSVVTATCDGLGHCPALGPNNSKVCAPFACSNDVCLLSCADDVDCAYGYRCEGEQCIPGACDGDHTVIASGKTVDCSPYKCTRNAECRKDCETVDDCASPNVCDLSGKCIAPEEIGDVGGCSASSSSTAPSHAGLAALALCALMAARRRRSPR
jgi:MYXO-CTERM domain-containing protein